MKKFAVHQFHFHAAGHDAITNQMRFLRQSLQGLGMAGEIFAVDIKAGAADVAHLWDPRRVHEGDVLLIHHSQGNPLLMDLLSHRAKKGLVYHNVTPHAFFKHDPIVAELSRLGRTQLGDFSGRIDFAFADSLHNAEELRQFGVSPVEVLPLRGLSTLEKKRPEVKRPKSSKRKLLFVGRLAPHKNQAGLIETLYYLNQLQAGSELFLVGHGDPIYTSYLKDLAKMLKISPQVHILGSISSRARDELYTTSDAFVCLSQHEGFCIPLVEAMAAGLPIFSTTHSGMAETLGPAGLQLKTERPAEVAAIVHATLSDDAAVKAMVDGGTRRLHALGKIQNLDRVRELFEQLRATVEGPRRAAAVPPPKKRKSHASTPPSVRA